MGDRLNSLLADHALLRLAWDNWAEVVPGKLYRSNHPTPRRLAAAARRFGLRTVVNLRGEKPNGSTSLSLRAADALGLDHVFAPFESRGAPHRDRILQFHETYRTMRLPALIHCKSGADRAGLVAGLAVLFEGGTAAAAARELSLRFLHFRRSRTGILDAFFARYAREGEGRIGFLDWVRDESREADLRRDFSASGVVGVLNDWVLRRE